MRKYFGVRHHFAEIRRQARRPEKLTDLEIISPKHSGRRDQQQADGQPDDAQRAFKALAYARFGPTPLYLEWAPGDVFTAEAMQKGEKQLNDEIKKIEGKQDEA